MINNKFIFYRTYSAFENDKTEGKIPEESIVFIKDKQLIYTHDTMFQRLSVDSISLGYFPTESKLTEQFPNGFQSKRAVAFIGSNSPYDIYVYDGKVWINSGCKLNAIKGDDGPVGPRGPKGDTGLQGPKGDNGKSAYEVAVDEGFAGDEQEWLDSLIGPKGDKGEKGDPGNISNIVLVEDHSGHGSDYTKYYVASADSDNDLYTRINSEVDRATELERIFGETLHHVMSIVPTDAIINGKMLATQEYADDAAGNALATARDEIGDLSDTVDGINEALGERISNTQLLISSESTRAQSVESALDTAIEGEITRSTNKDKDHSDAIEAINDKIPAEASEDNQLADKAFVNSSISTATADFKGTYNLINDLELPIDATKTAIQNKLLTKISTADINDYCFVQIPTSAETPDQVAIIQRYKHTADKWVYEYDLNNSGYTAEQWAAINSNMTAELTTKLTNLPTNAQLGETISGINADIATKLDKISDLDTIRSGATAGANAVQPAALNDYYKKGQVDTKLSELDIPVVTANGGNGILVKDKHNISNGGHSVALGTWGDSSGASSLTTGFVTQALGAGSTATGFLTTANGTGSFSGGKGDALLNITRIGEKTYLSDDILVSDLGRYITRSSVVNKLAKVTSVINKTFTTDVELSEDAEFTAHICRTIADGEGSFAFGKHVVTVSDNQVALGKYNLSDATSLLMVGNGSSDTNRSNALEVTKNGNLRIQGTLSIQDHSDVGSEIGFAKAEITEIKKKIPTEASQTNQLADKAYVDNKVGTAVTDIDQDIDDIDDTLAQHIGNTNVHLSNALTEAIAKIPENASSSNYIVTKELLDTKQDTLTFDTIPTKNSTNPVTSDGICSVLDEHWEHIDNAEGIATGILSHMPSGLEVGETLVGGQQYGETIANIYSELSNLELGILGKQDTLTFDTTPTADSSNPVTSNGIKEAIDNATPNLQYDNLPTYHSEKLVKSGRIYAALGYRQELVYETDEPTSTSNRIVTSKSAYAYVNPIKLDVATIKSYIPSGTNSTDNKLVNQSDISNFQTELEFDDSPKANSSNPVKSSGIYTALNEKQNTLTFDTIPTAGSDRPVTSAGIREAIDSAKPNLQYDNLPTANSEKLVKSDGIYTALGNRSKLTFDTTPTAGSTNLVTSNGIYLDIKGIKDKIPTQASSTNQLADKQYVDTNISTASATFRGTYHEKDDLGLSNDATHKQIADALKTVATPADLNDYCFVQIPEYATSPDIIRVERYKYANNAWSYEYDLNNSGFTGAQWAAINSGVTEINYAKHDHTHKVKINNTIKEITKTGSEDVVNLGNYLTAVPLATITALGGFKIGYLQNDKNYAVKLDENNRAYVNVPWTDTNTTYSVFSATLAGLVPAANSTNKIDAETAVGNHYLCADGKFRKLPANAFKDTTYSVFSESANGLVPMASTSNKTTAETKVGNYYLCADGKYRLLPANAFLNTTYSFVDENPTLAWSTKSKVATVGGTDIHVTMPAKPTYTLDDVADGSTRKLANYLPLTGGTLSGPLSIITSNNANNPFTIQCSGSKHITMGFSNSDGSIGKVGYLDGNMKVFGVHKSGKAFGFNINSLPVYYNGNSTYTVWHAGNGGSGSGLDADKLDGQHASDFATRTWVNDNFNKYVLPVATSAALGGIKSGGDITVNSSTGVVKVDKVTTDSGILRGMHDAFNGALLTPADDRAGVALCTLTDKIGTYLGYYQGESFFENLDGGTENAEFGAYADGRCTMNNLKTGKSMGLNANGTGYVNANFEVTGSVHATAGISSDTYVTALATSTTSDKRLKDIKENLDLPIETFAEAPAVKFEWKNNKELGMQAGTIAQYWEEKLKEVVHEGEDGNLSMQYDVAALLGTITIAKKVVEQEDRIKKLEELIEQIKNKLL